MNRPALLSFLLLALATLACSGTGPAKETAAPAAFRPWGMIGAKIVDTLEGVTVSEVVTGSTAARAGIRVGDILVAVNGRAGTGTQEMIDHIRGRLPGSELTVTLKRQNRRLELRLATGAYPVDEQIWVLASHAEKGFDYERALTLCSLFRDQAPPASRYRERIERLEARLRAMLR